MNDQMEKDTINVSCVAGKKDLYKKKNKMMNLNDIKKRLNGRTIRTVKEGTVFDNNWIDIK